MPCSFCCLCNRWRQWLIHSTKQAYPHPNFRPARRRNCPPTAVSTQKICFFHPHTAVAGRFDRRFARTRPWLGEKSAFFTRAQPWQADSTVVSPGHGHGWARNPLFSPAHGHGWARNPLFSHAHGCGWPGNPVFSPRHGCGRAKRPSFSPKTPIFLLNTQS